MKTHKPGTLAATAFSLIELSIVLVILGLLTGGILAGQSLIRAAELRSITTDQNRYVTAAQTFRDKYFQLPGDMNNAQSFWGVANATAATCVTTPSTDKATCNGNGDGMIYPSAGSNESYRFWQHLANAGLIEGTYDGITHGSNSFSSTQENSPRGRIGSSLWFVWNWTAPQTGQWVFDGTYGNRISTGIQEANSEPMNAILTPPELWNIDIKMDDGLPAQGKVKSAWYLCTNATASSQLNATYNLTSTTKSCMPLFVNAF
jgi:prepilin-type N-terminal cleavage/methylation domain-containing protein